MHIEWRAGMIRMLVNCLFVFMLLPLVANSAALAQSPSCFPAPEGLVAWWPGDGDASDVQGGNDGALDGIGFTLGKVDQAFGFDGVDDAVRVPDAPALSFGGDFTVDFWIQLNGPNSRNHRLINKGAGTGSLFQGWDIHYNASPKAIRVVIGNGVGGFCTIDGTTDIADGLLHHLAVVIQRAASCDTNVVRIYLDGALEPRVTTLATAHTAAALNTNHALHMGTGHPGTIPGSSSPQAFAGILDEIEIFDRALTGAEIFAIFDADSAGKCKDEDGDGFRPPDDCDESDSAINPGATELPGNFVDEDCNGDLGDCSPCNDWRNHGEFIRCVSQAVELLVSGGALTQDEGDALAGSAARSDVGKKSFVLPPECTAP